MSFFNKSATVILGKNESSAEFTETNRLCTTLNKGARYCKVTSEAELTYNVGPALSKYGTNSILMKIIIEFNKLILIRTESEEYIHHHVEEGQNVD